MSPQRVQRQRTKGWRKPEGAVYVGRGSKWGNPFTMGGNFELSERHGWGTTRVLSLHSLSATSAVALYELWLSNHHISDAPHPGWVHVAELAGKDLMCWCPLDQPCHADVLLELANGATR